MKLQSIKVLFLLNKSKTSKDGKCPIYCRITYKGLRKQFSTGEKVLPGQWNSKKQTITNTNQQTEQVNSKLILIKQKINSAFLKLKLNSEKDFDTEDILDIFFDRRTRREETTLGAFKIYLARIKDLVGKEIKPGTYKKFVYSFKFTQDYIYFKYNKKDIRLKELNLQFVNDFDHYLRTKRNLGRSTINKVIQRFRKPIRNAIAEGLLERDPFVLYKSKTVKKPVVFLSEEELHELIEYSFSQSRLNFVKDLFVFSCYTGLAYNELMTLEKQHISKGFDGNLWINMTREKTIRLLSIPILPKAEEMIDKYISHKNRIFPSISNQKYNSYLKEIADIVGINKRMTTHMARRTFASTVLLYNNVPMEIVSELLGHSSIKITQDSYAMVVQKKISLEMEKLKGSV